MPPDEAAFWAIKEGGQLVGVVGCEFDPALARAWVRAPLLTDGRLLADILPVVGATLESALAQVTQFDAFPAADGAGLNHWYAAAGYEALQVHRVLRATVGKEPAMARSVRRAATAELPALLSLHQSLFPNAYIGRTNFERAVAQGGDCALFAARSGDAAPIGYLYVKDDPVEHEAYIDYLGVMPAHRGQGFGRALLALPVT